MSNQDVTPTSQMTSVTPTDLDTVRFAEERKLKLKFWVGFQVGIPVFFIIIMWPFTGLLSDDIAHFRDIFAPGDLVLLGASLFLGSVAELYYEQVTNQHLKGITKLSEYFMWNLVLGIIFLLVFALTKSSYVHYQSIKGTQELVARKMLGCAWLSILAGSAATFFAVRLSYSSTACIVDNYTQQSQQVAKAQI